jgi:hypothetical protein
MDERFVMILRQLRMRLGHVIQRLFEEFSILELTPVFLGWALLLVIVIKILSGCTHAPKQERTEFKPKWTFCENVPSEPLACLTEADVKVLRQVILECQARGYK